MGARDRGAAPATRRMRIRLRTGAAGVLFWGPAERRAGRGLRALGEHMASGTGRALLRPARRCVVFALSGAPARVPAGALDRRALDRFLGSAVGLCGDRVRGGDRGLGRLLFRCSSGRSRARCNGGCARAQIACAREDQRRQDEQRAESEPGQFRERAREQRQQQDRRAGDAALRASIPASSCRKPHHDERAEHQIVVRADTASRAARRASRRRCALARAHP